MSVMGTEVDNSNCVCVDLVPCELVSVEDKTAVDVEDFNSTLVILDMPSTATALLTTEVDLVEDGD